MAEPFIVVGVDGAEAAAGALRWSMHEAYTHDARLLVVYAYAEPAAGDMSMVPLDPVQFMDEARQAAEAWREDAMVGEPSYPTVAVDVQARLGPPGPVLVDASCGALMLVVGASGHHPLHRLVHGSVSRYCVGRAQCPVVAVPLARMSMSD